MQNKKIRILNFDNSIVAQKGLFSKYNIDVLGCLDLAQDTRLWMSALARSELRRRISFFGKGDITFLGSGDFHQVTSLLVEKFDEPICIIDFDLHPDWCIFPPRSGCGAWVTEALRKANILKCVLIGASSEDISAPGLYCGKLSLLKNDRVELYPYSRNQSKIFLKSVPDNISIEVKRSPLASVIYWNELKDKNLSEFFLHTLKRLPSKKVYVTIDKDCLTRDHAMTNWEEGRLSLDELLIMLKMIKENCEIVGLDITGDYSAFKALSFIKKIASFMDHPKEFTAKGRTESEILSINEDTNLKILAQIF